MEKRIKHRILGMLVISGLVILALPLFQSSKELRPDTALTKSPPFPDSVSVTLPPTSVGLVPPVMDNMAESVENIAPPQPDASLNPQQQKVEVTVKAQTAEKKPQASVVANKPVKVSPKPADKRKIDDEALIALKNPAWVVQVGSFKNKANALNIVNQLRASGFRAFIQQTPTALGDSTRVIVGPEKNKKMARALASRLQIEMHLQGIVMSYQPLAL